MFRRFYSVVGGSMLLLVLGGGCQAQHVTSAQDWRSEQWKSIYQMCMKRGIHQSPALAMSLDIGKLSDLCRGFAFEATGRL